MSRLYGLRGFTHGWAATLTVLCEDGASRERALIEPGDSLERLARPGHLSIYLEKREGALEALVERYRITVLDKPEWDRCKQALGARAYA